MCVCVCVCVNLKSKIIGCFLIIQYIFIYIKTKSNKKIYLLKYFEVNQVLLLLMIDFLFLKFYYSTPGIKKLC
jgi:hypothetical protein